MRVTVFDEPNETFLDFLGKSGRISETAADRIRLARLQSSQTVDVVLTELGLLEEEALAEALSEFLGLQRAREPEFPDDLAEEFAAHHDFLRRAQVLPSHTSDGKLTVITATPLEPTAAHAVAYMTGHTPILKVAARGQLRRHLEQLLNPTRGAELPLDIVNLDDIDRLRDVASEAPIIKLLNDLIADAVERQASDIHLEVMDDHLRVRLRLDGRLVTSEHLDRRLHLGVVTRIKILARLNIAEQRLPQDGRISIAVKGRDIDLRVATSPTAQGENIVLRILDKRGMNFDLAALGFNVVSAQQLRVAIANPNGIVLVTGPTGSGKTTTLYAALTLLNAPETKIFSIEDPIEYKIRGVNQILVRPQIDLTFSNILRSVLRQDPDVIMVGEIRDRETAQISVQAALTGHLVLSTLHTNSAVSSVTRLRDLGIDNFLMAASLRAVTAQRLVRKTCSSCSGAGCKSCNNSGYLGRTVITEIIPISERISNAIARGANEVEILAEARAEGFLSMQESGVEKVREGYTTQTELTRALGVL